ncbi:hypothetical protein CFP56_024472 [Quercus suber]|uniref:Uncharacterized protein n=1 Tax=Quercus suber TaxID=58331 RepID=A0AAW0LXD8_QUESU
MVIPWRIWWRQKKRPELVLPNLGDNEKMEKSGIPTLQRCCNNPGIKPIERSTSEGSQQAAGTITADQIGLKMTQLGVLESAVLKYVLSLLDLLDNVAQVAFALCKMKMGMACGG